MTQRFKLLIEYDGTPFHGWAKQQKFASVQGHLEAAFMAFCQEEVMVQCAGRTDAGVHATGQIAHVDLACDRTPYQILGGINFHLKDLPIVLVEVEPCDKEFHARFSATGREYIYRMVNRPAPLALDATRAWQVGWELDVDAMREGAKRFLGTHDWSSFRASECQAKSPIKTLDRLDIEVLGDELRFHVAAQSFLHHKVFQ